ncbi:WD40 repeat domain-containing protein [Streptomyces celluloflavus]|uniref:WD40 repeat domain-containing protein n=1 Tax=Streptomyces celluloflavus TaxID=58344 RepID=UPI0036C302C7
MGRALLDWTATTDDSLPRLCLLRGGRASGKSYLLAWFLAGSAGHPRTAAHAAVPSDGLTADALAWEMGRQLGYGPLPPHRLLNRVAADQRPLLLLLPDFHLAGRGHADQQSVAPQEILDELLFPLVQFPHVRAVVEAGSTDILSTSDHHVIDLGEAPFPGAARPSPAAPDFASLFAGVPRTADGRPDWSRAPRTVRKIILDTALHTDDDGAAVRALLADPGFLVHGPTTGITAALHSAATPAPPGLRAIWDRAAPQLSDVDHSDNERGALLHAASLGTSTTLSEYLRPLAERHRWTATWAQHGVPAATHSQLPGNDGRLLLSDPLGRLHTHDPATGHRTGMLPSPPAIRPTGIAGSGTDALLLLDETGLLHPLTPDEESMAATVLGHIASHHSHALLTSDTHRPTALGSCPQSSLVAIGDASGAVHLWSLAEYRPTPRTCRLHTVPVTAVTCLRLPGEDLTFTISAAFDGSIRLWETSQRPMESPVDQRPALVTALAAAGTPVGPLLAAAWNDSEIHLWHILSGKVHILPTLYRCSALALTPTGQLTVSGPDGFHAIQLDLDRLWA